MHICQIDNPHQKQAAVTLDYCNFTKSLRKLPFVMAVLLSCGQGSPAYADQSNGADKSYKADSEEYRKAMSEYGKEIFAARYTEKWCGKVYGIRFNEVYFRVGPPNLWNKEVYDKFMATSSLGITFKLDGRARHAMWRNALALYCGVLRSRLAAFGRIHR
jgi:hypothetical protein